MVEKDKRVISTNEILSGMKVKNPNCCHKNVLTNDETFYYLFCINMFSDTQVVCLGTIVSSKCCRGQGEGITPCEEHQFIKRHFIHLLVSASVSGK